MNNINFFKEDVSVDLRTFKRYKKWLNLVAKSYTYQITSLNYIFCSDTYLHKINLDYLNHDTYTDIITFDLNEANDSNKMLEGDIFISLDRITDNATTLNIQTELELARVMAHGLLHLIGFEDDTAMKKTIMRTEENKAIELL